MTRSISIMPKHLSVNELIPACERTISTFEAKIGHDNDAIQREILSMARSILGALAEAHTDFHVKVETSGPPKLAKYDDGHEYTVQQRCYGDGRDVANCGRLFVKVGWFWRNSCIANQALAKCTHQDHKDRQWSCTKGTLLGRVSEWDLKVLLDLREKMWTYYDNIAFLCRVDDPDKSTPTPKRRKATWKKVDDVTNEIDSGPKQRKGVQKGRAVEATPEHEIRVFVKAWLEVHSTITASMRH